MADDGPLQLSLSGQQDLAEITSGNFPGERLIACRNPVLAAERARKREDLLQATERLLAPIAARVRAGRLAGAGPIGVETGKVISKHKVGKHLTVTITDDSLTVTRKQDQARRAGLRWIKAWAPLTYTDEHPPAPGQPRRPATRSSHAQAKASRSTTSWA